MDCLRLRKAGSGSQDVDWEGLQAISSPSALPSCSGNWEVQALLMQRRSVGNQLQCRAGFSSHLLPWNPGSYNPVELVGSAQGGNLWTSQEKTPWAYVICALWPCGPQCWQSCNAVRDPRLQGCTSAPRISLGRVAILSWWRKKWL